MTAVTLPESVATLVGVFVDRPIKILPLGGMSGSCVFKVKGPGGSVVVKGGVSSREAAVYRLLSPALADAGIRIPTLHGATNVDDRVWLLLEDIPAPLPRDRWLADPEVFATLQRLYHLDSVLLHALPDRLQPDWSGAMTDAALHWLGNDPDTGRRVTDLREDAAPLFEPVSVISGDPNPLNWGISGAGELALMDWERIGFGHPAVDVAITMPGLPTLDEFDRVAVDWRMIASNLSLEGLPIRTRELVLAKLWTVIELLAESPPLGDIAQRHGPMERRQETAVAVARVLPDWIRRVT